MDGKGNANPDGAASAGESNDAVGELNEQESAELMGSVASELGIGGVVETGTGQEALGTSDADEAGDDEDDDAADAEEPEESEADADDAADEASEEELTDADAKGLSAEGRALVNKRIGKVIAQRNEARERAAALEQQIGQLRDQVDKPVRAQIAQALNVDPMFLAQSDQEIADSESHWWKVKQFTEQHMHREDGYTDEQSGRTFSREQLLARHAQADEMLMRGLPQARQVFEQRKQCVEVAQAAYPDLYKAGTPEAQVRSNALRTIPGLAQLPNADILIGDMIAGQRLREAAKKTDKATTKVGGKKTPESVARPAKVPVKPAPAKRSPVTRKPAAQEDSLSPSDVAAWLGI